MELIAFNVPAPGPHVTRAVLGSGYVLDKLEPESFQISGQFVRIKSESPWLVLLPEQVRYVSRPFEGFRVVQDAFMDISEDYPAPRRRLADKLKRGVNRVSG
jgi:hypothetical protein